MELSIKPVFKNLIPPLTAEEFSQLEKNQLGFSAEIHSNGSIKFIQLLPTTIGNCYWHAACQTLPDGIEEYTKRPIALSRLHCIDFLKYGIGKLIPFKCNPVEIDYYDRKQINKKQAEKTNVYIIQANIGGPVKIGKANNIEDRIKQHQVGWIYKTKADLIVFISKKTRKMIFLPFNEKFKSYYKHIRANTELIKNKISVHNNKKWQSAYRKVPFELLKGYISIYEKV
jgi:predicted GIY-YIG superfamily endonuclease